MKTLKTAALILSLTLIGAIAPVICAAELMKPGLWEITSTMDMPGMPRSVPPMTSTHCYTKQDVDDAKKLVSSGSRDREDCMLTDHKVVGNKVTWNVQCRGRSAGSGSGEMVLKGDSYEGTMKLISRDPRGGAMQMTQHIKGRRVGDCQ